VRAGAVTLLLRLFSGAALRKGDRTVLVSVGCEADLPRAAEPSPGWLDQGPAPACPEAAAPSQQEMMMAEPQTGIPQEKIKDKIADELSKEELDKTTGGTQFKEKFKEPENPIEK
jgi:hypothetical protein